MKHKTILVNWNTIEVPGWKLGEDSSGRLVKIEGYSMTDSKYEKYIVNKLKTLLEGKSEELKNVVKVDDSEGKDKNIIHFSVFLNEINIATYFGELNIKDKV